MSRAKLLTATAVAALVAGILGTSIALARPGAALFELDADTAGQKPAITDNTTSGLPDDWDRVCKTFTASSATPQCTTAASDHADARTFDSETTLTGGANNASIFTGGGSKDPLAISGWKWKDLSGGLPDKDNLLHAMSARYTDRSTGPLNGTQYVFFAADRFDNSGDSQIGFWFFQSAVGPVAGGTFTGEHVARDTTTGTRGDILILSDFTQGGTQPTIRIYEWVGSGGSDGSLNLIGGNTDDVRDCAIVPSDDFCASVNPADGADSPWLFLNKDGKSTFGHGEFYEGGVNLNNLGLQNQCFPSFLAETRSSQSTTATLKDFVGGTFQNCTPSLVTTPSATVGSPVTPGTSVTDTLDLTINGSTNPPAPTGTITFFLCGPIATGACDGTTDAAHTGTSIGAGSALALKSGTTNVYQSTSPAVNASPALTPGRYCFRSEWPGDTTYKPVAPATKFVEFGTGNSECFAVATIPTQTVTTPVDASGTTKSSITLGESIFDKAVVTGTSVGGDPTGSVTFFVCKLASGTCDGVTNVGTQVGSPSTGESLVSDGVAGTFTSVATSDAFTPTTTGRYCFRANYGGSSIYDPSSDSAATECFTVGKLPTTTTTTPVNATGTPTSTITLGGSIFDRAVVSGSAAGGDPTGVVKFFVCKIETGTCDGTINVGTQVGSPSTGEALVGNNNNTATATSDAFTPSAVGRYCFRGEYGGDDDYDPSSDSAATECFTVTDTFSNSSAQTWVPNDTATVAATNGSPLSGTLTIALYETNNCSGTAVTNQTYTKTLNGATSLADRTLTTSNSTYSVSATKSVSWLVTFSSTNAYITGTTHCEVSSLTITN